MSEEKRVCECTNCGNEAEMVVTCTWVPPEGSEEAKAQPGKVKKTVVCSSCGTEADIWVEAQQ